MATCGFSIFEVTDGTDTISFVESDYGFFLNNWIPTIAPSKGGGVFVSSALSHGRRLVEHKHDNAIETLDLKLRGSSQNDAFTRLRALRTLLNKARTYWITEWQNDPVWVKVKAPEEDQPRYSLVYDWSTPDDNNPFRQPLWNYPDVVLDNFSLLIERAPFWTNEIPGNDTAVPLSTIQTFNGVTVGNVDDTGTRETVTDGTAFIANKHNLAQLTHVYEDDGGVWTQLFDQGVPHRLMPANYVANDALYFVIDTAVGDAGPFHSLIFDISVAAVGGNIVWEYYDSGTGWTAFSTAGAQEIWDWTSDFTNTGVLTVWFRPPGTWTTRALNTDGGPAITAWAVRARATGAGTGGTQQNRNIYTVTWPYVEIQSADIGGDLPALTRTRIKNLSSSGSGTPNTTWQWTTDVMYGTRGVDRGENFSAYIPLSDTQNLPGVTVTSGLDFTDVHRASTSRGQQKVFAGVVAMANEIRVTLASPYASEYTGTYRAFLRLYTDDTVEYFQIQLVVQSSVNTWTSPVLHPPDYYGGVDPGDYPWLLDFGLVRLPPASIDATEDLEFLVLDIWHAFTDAGGGTINYYDLILMPVDEYTGSFGIFEVPVIGGSVSSGDEMDGLTYLDIDSTTKPKRPVYCPLRETASDDLQQIMRDITSEPASVNSGRRSRVWFLFQDNSNATASIPTGKLSKASYGHSLQMWAKQQYYSFIGDNL